jgi:hypothetical protein
MSRSSQRTPDSSGRNRRAATTLDLKTARKMLPLVRSILADIQGFHARLGELNPEQERLERNRRALDWSARDRRYSIGEDIRAAESGLSTAVGELDDLGVELVDVRNGEVDFPTRINGRSAAFSWKSGEDAVSYWHYKGEGTRRPIPSDWVEAQPQGLPA